MKIFISSVIGGYEAYRDAVEDAVKTLGHQVTRAENFPASSDSPQVACLKGVRGSDVVIVLVGARYGEIQPSGFSATHEELLEARDKKPIIAFVESDVTRDKQQTAFLENVQAWATGLFTEEFAAADELKRKVTLALHEYLVSSSVADVDIEAISERARRRLGDTNSRYTNSAALEFSIAVGPTQTLLRPAIIGKAEIVEEIIKLAAFGANRVFDISLGTDNQVKDHELIISQQNGFIRVSSQGDMLIRIPLKQDDQVHSVIIEESLQDTILKLLLFSSELLEHLDPTQKTSHVALYAQLLDTAHYGWQTRQEHQRANGTYSISGFGNNKNSPVSLSPPCFKRGVLKFDASTNSEDILALLKRNHSGG